MANEPSAFAGSGDPEYLNVLAREFSMITPENQMKMGPLRPNRATFAWSSADAMVSWAEAHNMKVRGHTLVWHEQLPEWLKNGKWTRDDVVKLFKEHIYATATRFRGMVYCWDVVNEAIDDETGGLRKTFWLNHIGPDYIEMAFRSAREADPEALLFYNDYNIERPGLKSNRVFALVKRLKDKGVPIDGVGFQAHFDLSAPSRSGFAGVLQKFTKLGLKVHVTELDVRLKLPVTEKSLSRQAEVYADTFGACLDTPGWEAVVTWGFTDRRSWVPGFFRGYGAALPFDASYRPKPAYNRVMQLLRNHGAGSSSIRAFFVG